MGPIQPIYDPSSIDGIRSVGKTVKQSPSADRSNGFSELLRQEMREVGKRPKGVSFSKHAEKRSEQRGIRLEGPELEKISSAVDKLEKKGAKEALVLYRQVGLLVNVKDRRIITCVDKDGLKDNVFTNIDGVMFLE